MEPRKLAYPYSEVPFDTKEEMFRDAENNFSSERKSTLEDFCLLALMLSDAPGS